MFFLVKLSSACRRPTLRLVDSKGFPAPYTSHPSIKGVRLRRFRSGEVEKGEFMSLELVMS